MTSPPTSINAFKKHTSCKTTGTIHGHCPHSCDDLDCCDKGQDDLGGDEILENSHVIGWVSWPNVISSSPNSSATSKACFYPSNSSNLSFQLKRYSLNTRRNKQWLAPASSIRLAWIRWANAPHVQHHMGTVWEASLHHSRHAVFPNKSSWASRETNEAIWNAMKFDSMAICQQYQQMNLWASLSQASAITGVVFMLHPPGDKLQLRRWDYTGTAAHGHHKSWGKWLHEFTQNFNPKQFVSGSFGKHV